MGSFALPSNNPQPIPLASLPLYKILNQLECAAQQIESVECRLKNTYCITLTNSDRLYLQVFPGSSIPLLRKERYGLESEILTLRLLASLQLPTPRIVSCDEGSTLLGVPFLLTTGIQGRPLVSYFHELTDHRYTFLEAQITALESRIASLRSSTFGPMAAVAKGQGYRRWRDAFTEMILSLLRDAEDAFLNLPYAAIRQALEITGPTLDTITDARLVLPGLSIDRNIYVEEMGGNVQVVGFRDFKDAIWSDVDFLPGKPMSSSNIVEKKTLL